MESERLQDGIAIHYSMPSVHGASILGYHQNFDGGETRAPEKPTANFPANRDGWVRVVKDLGLQFDFVASEQLEKGALALGKYRVLILPLSVALSAEEAKAIKRFVSEGGVVIADAAAGMMNEHCSWRPGGMLDELFGIKAASNTRTLAPGGGAISVTTNGLQWGLEAKALEGMTAAEGTVRATTGKPLARVGDADAVIVRQSGNGWAVYLNSLLDRYPKQRAENYTGAQHRALINAIFERAGIRPAAGVFSADGARLAGTQFVRYRFGGAEVVAVVTENVAVERAVGRDGVTVYSDAGLGKVARQEITVKLPRKAHVNDVRAAKGLGHTDTVRTSVVLGDTVVLGLSPSANSVGLHGPAAAKLGEHPEFSVTSSTQGPSLVRIEVFAPDGSPVQAYAKNLLLDGGDGGRAGFALPTALDDPAGVYTLRATDVVTGASAAAKISVR
jgi:hypothetical protein